jgi:mitochondrial fission protein ELM1
MDFRIKPWAFEEARVTVWDAADLEAQAEYIGLAGSPTIVTELAAAALRERKREMLHGSPHDVTRRLVELLKEAL